ncbi:casein kinase II, regulatory subunit, partial [Cladochytrium replicatum]
SGTSSSVVSWISWYCSLPGHEFFLEVPESFIEDDFNLTGLNQMVQLYNEALDMILDLEPEDPHHLEKISLIEASAEQLYNLIHQRYVITKQGLQSMAERLQDGYFGYCPRVLCGSRCGVLPVGITDQPNTATMKLLCPRCSDIYHPSEQRHAKVDGAVFGTTFPHLLFLTFPNLVPPLRITPPKHSRRPHGKQKQGLDGSSEPSDVSDSESDSDESESSLESDGSELSEDDDDGSMHDDGFDEELDYQIYFPKIFGFKVSVLSRSGPRMRWLRWKEGMGVDLVLGPGRSGREENSTSTEVASKVDSNS